MSIRTKVKDYYCNSPLCKALYRANVALEDLNARLVFENEAMKRDNIGLDQSRDLIASQRDKYLEELAEKQQMIEDLRVKVGVKEKELRKLKRGR